MVAGVALSSAALYILCMRKTAYTVTPGELSAHFGMHEETARRWCRAGRVDCIRLVGEWRIHRDVINPESPGYGLHRPGVPRRG